MTGSTTALLPNGATNTAYDVNDRIVGHTYDLDGNETTVNGQAAGYDFENHLVSLGSVASYVYDADGNRVNVSSGGATTSYAVDTCLPYASVIEEYAGPSAAPSARYDYGDDLVRMDRGSGVYYYIYDGLGSTRQLVSTSGTVTDSYGYSAFGELASHTGSTVNPFLFNAQQFDGASGDYYLRARYYDQSNGRFISQDPFGGSDEDPLSLHRYLYAANDSINNSDPTGRETLVGLSIGSSIAASLASIKNSVDLDIYNTVSDAVQYGTQGAIDNFAIGLALSGAAVIAPSIAKRLGKSARNLAPAFRRVASALRAVLEEGCFVSGTPIQLRYGRTCPIEKIKKGDFVQSRDIKTGRTKVCRVLRTFVHLAPTLIAITLTNDLAGAISVTITATPNHPFFVRGVGFTEAGSLHVGDALITRTGSPIFVANIIYKHRAKGYLVYNFEVEGYHTYFVGNTKRLFDYRTLFVERHFVTCTCSLTGIAKPSLRQCSSQTRPS